MFNQVECPYCDHDNEMTDYLADLGSDNKFDAECGKCEKEFEVEVEFDPVFSSEKIEYTACEICGNKTRDINKRGRVFPFPTRIKENEICQSCFLENVGKDMDDGIF